MEIALGVLLGLLGVVLVVLAGLLITRRRRPGAHPGADDDLPGFLESPPGTAPSLTARPAGWATLTATPTPAPDAGRPVRDDRLAPGAVAAGGVLLVALAVGMLTARDDAGRPAPHRTAAAEDLTAHLSFAGVVLDRHAVGVTAAYPSLEVTTEGGRAVAHLELATFHCLTDAAPEDPTAAGCRRAGTEYADLDTPELSVTSSDDRLRVSGDFATYLRPTGASPRPTGRVYRVEVSAVSTGGTVEGTLDLGAERARTTPDPGVNVLRRGS